jgi:chromosome segregation ATPase
MADDIDEMTKTPEASGNEVEKTDEQVWQELEAEEAGKAEGEDDDAPELQADMADETDETPSDDTDDDGEGDKPDTTGMDPEQLQAQIDRLQHSLKSEKGRTAASRREIEELNRRIGAAEKTQRTNADESHLKERREKIKATTEEYADVIGPIAEHITDLEARLDSLTAREKADLEGMKNDLQDRMTQELGVFEKEHPDGLDTIVKNRDTFDAWIEDQPKALRDIYAANEQAIVDGRSAALLVGMFKQALLDGNGNPAPANTEQQRLSTRRERQLAGAASTRSSSRTTTTSAPPKDGADPAVHWDYFEKMDARKKG